MHGADRNQHGALLTEPDWSLENRTCGRDPPCTPSVHFVSKGNKWHKHHYWTPSTTCTSEHPTRHLRCCIIPAAGESLQTQRQQSTAVPFSTQDQATGQKVLLEAYSISTQHRPLIQDLLGWLQTDLQTHHPPASLFPTRMDSSRKALQDDPQGTGRRSHRWHHYYICHAVFAGL